MRAMRLSLSLALLVLGVDANHPHHAAPVDHLAFVTNLFYRCPYFHAASLLASKRGRAKARPYKTHPRSGSREPSLQLPLRWRKACLLQAGRRCKTRPYLYRYTMRPRVKSYGESSTATLSPARIRMKFLRILPETCARTWCLFSSSTRNIAFGNGSITVAMTSMASSLGFPESPFLLSSNGCFGISSYKLSLTTTARSRLSAGLKSTDRWRSPRRCARNGPKGCHRP